MMGSRGTANGDEYDAFARRGRHLIGWKRGERHAIKQGFARRMRRIARQWTKLSATGEMSRPSA